MSAGLYAVIEGGGTRFNCALMDGGGESIAERAIATADPLQTLDQCVDFFRSRQSGRSIESAAIACFGPLDIDLRSPRYGAVLGTPKPGWEGFNPRSYLQQALAVPVVIDTDVAGSALGELHAGAGRGLENFVYITVGTGIGAAVIAGGELQRGASHYEFGHLPARRVPGDSYAGHCAFHGDCVSGLACGPALMERWSTPGESLAPDHEAWDMEANYLAQLCLAAIYSYAPQAIIFGGGVMQAPGLLEKLRDAVAPLLGDYHCAFFGVRPGMPAAEITTRERIARGIVRPGAGKRSALLGAFHMARHLAS